MGLLKKIKKHLKSHANPADAFKLPGTSNLDDKIESKTGKVGKFAGKLNDKLDPIYLVNKTNEETGLKETDRNKLEDLPDVPGIDDPQVAEQILQEQQKLRKRRGILSTKLTGPQGLLGGTNTRRPSLINSGG